MVPKSFAVAIVLSLLSFAATADTALLSGKWLAEDINGGGVIDRLQTTLEFGADGQVFGTGGCNRYMGSAKIDGNAISFSPLAGTRMMCSPAAMDQETKFHTALERVKSWRIDQTKLVLLDGAGAIAVRLDRMN